MVYLIFSSLIPIAITVGIIVLIVTLVKNKSRTDNKPFTEKDGEIMLKHIYTYAVLFVTLMMSIGGSVSVFMGVAEYASPSTYIEPFHQYKENRVTVVQSNENLSEEALRRDYEMKIEDEKQEARMDAVRHIIQSLGWIVIPFPIFLYFQRQRKREMA